MTLKLSNNSIQVLEKRYVKDGETAEDMFRRVAHTVASAEPIGSRDYWEDKFYELISSTKFLPNSPTLANAGTDSGNLSACFCISPSDNMESITQTIKDWALTEKWGGGVGIGLGDIRPKGSKISTTHGIAFGPVAIMEILSLQADKITQGSFRLGAHMAQLPISHPDIREFIHCKDKDGVLANFNISVQIPDKFMDAVENGESWALIDPNTKETTEWVNARQLWNELIESAHKTGDPGVVFIDRVHETAPCPTLGEIKTSNPCGEQFLENYNSCNLGSIDLGKHIADDMSDFNWPLLEDTIRMSIRFLDDVVSINKFPVKEQERVNLLTRRIGLGVMGWADALVMLGIPYDSEEALELARKTASFIDRVGWNESQNLAETKGPFPLWSESPLQQEFDRPVRNCSITTVAPTGTIAIIADCSGGIEPHFALSNERHALWDETGATTVLYEAAKPLRGRLSRKFGEFEATQLLKRLYLNPNDKDIILREAGINPDSYRTASEIDPDWHIMMQAAWQMYITNSISKTINLPNEALIKDVDSAFTLAHRLNCKAVTVYRDGSRAYQPLQTAASTPVTEAPQKQERPRKIYGETLRTRTGHGNLYSTVNHNGDGNPFEMFLTLDKAGTCTAANLDALARLISLAFRLGASKEEVIKQLRGIICHPTWDEGQQVLSVPDAVALALKDLDEEVEAEAESLSMTGMIVEALETCEMCGSTNLSHQEKCPTCMDCGYSKCS